MEKGTNGDSSALINKMRKTVLQPKAIKTRDSSFLHLNLFFGSGHMPPSQAFQRLSEEHGQARSARAGDKQEAREGNDGNECRARATGDEVQLT